LGRSGAECANLLARKGFKVLASDSGPRDGLGRALQTLARGVEVETGRHTDAVLRAAFAVKSPGIDPDLPVLKRLKARRIPVFSEIEVALAFCPTDLVFAVTGTNGKSTTTALVGEILRSAGYRTHVGGNIGVPLSRIVRRMRPGDALALELSSYQLEDSRRVRPRAACILNLTPDHLDHHGGFGAYTRAKAGIFRSQGKDDLCAFNEGDPVVRRLAASAPSRRLFFGPGPKADVRFRTGKGRGAIRVALPGRRPFVLKAPNLPGRHNLENASAAAAMAAGFGLSQEALQRGFDRFRGIEHRLEKVGTRKGLACVNDSKATNVESTRVALEAFLGGGGARAKKLWLILGGRDKGSPYTPLAPLIRRTTRAILTIGEASSLIALDLKGTAPIVPCGTLETAVREAFRLGRSGEVLLLSPACASFDQFRDFEDRGRAFKRLVRRSVGRGR